MIFFYFFFLIYLWSKARVSIHEIKKGGVESVLALGLFIFYSFSTFFFVPSRIDGERRESMGKVKNLTYDSLLI